MRTNATNDFGLAIEFFPGASPRSWNRWVLLRNGIRPSTTSHYNPFTRHPFKPWAARGTDMERGVITDASDKEFRGAVRTVVQTQRNGTEQPGDGHNSGADTIYRTITHGSPFSAIAQSRYCKKISQACSWTEAVTCGSVITYSALNHNITSGFWIHTVLWFLAIYLGFELAKFMVVREKIEHIVYAED